MGCFPYFTAYSNSIKRSTMVGAALRILARAACSVFDLGGAESPGRELCHLFHLIFQSTIRLDPAFTTAGIQQRR
jgi:hypothetical protein